MPRPATPGADRCAAALDDLDGAAISTLHAFAQRLLTEFPIEAGLPPRVEVRDEIAAAFAFDARWEPLRRPALRRTRVEPQPVVVLGLAAWKFQQLRARRRGVRPRTGIGSLDQACRRRTAIPELEIAPVAHRARGGAAALRDRTAWTPAIKLLEPSRVRSQAYAASSRGRPRRTAPRSSCSGGPQPSFEERVGRKGSWRGTKPARSRIRRVADAGPMLRRDLQRSRPRRRQLVRAVADVRPRGRRRAPPGAGALEFHDLLVLARALLRATRARCRRRAARTTGTTRLLIDEFQDTDPIQIELAVLLAAADPEARRQPLVGDRGRRPGACSSSATRSSRSTGSAGPTSGCSSGCATTSAPASR